MWNIKAAVDIMGGGASAPDDIPIPKSTNSEKIIAIIMIAVISILTICALIGFIKDIVKRKNKDEEHK